MCTRYNIMYISSSIKTDSNHVNEILLKMALITITLITWLREMNKIERNCYPLIKWRLYLVCTVLYITLYATWGGCLKYHVATLIAHRKTCCSIKIHYTDSQPASSKWYSLMFCVHSWKLLYTRRKKKLQYQRCNQKRELKNDRKYHS